MELKELKPRKALNKAFLKVKPNRIEIEDFKANLIQLLDRTNDTESEEFHKNLVSDFLKKTYYEPNHFINTKGRNDLVIHNGNNANSSVGVIIEAKKPTNKAEMITTNKLNAKAFQELVLYYLRERITQKNLEVKYLIATNINEWFIFDATLFDRLFAQNKNFVKQFTDFESGRLADTKTDFFYKQIAKPFIDDIKSEIEFTYFNIQDYQEPLRNTEKADDNLLIALFKLLSAEHLLKLPFINDSNSLDKKFYSELLHIIGLTETKQGSKKLIERNKEGERNSGSILENTIIQLDSLDKINRLNQPSQFGKTQQERLFTVALELSITWINRILFLKLLEAQLIAYHKGDKAYSFLNLDKIKNYDDLNSLFFQVLARKHKDRNQDVQQAFENVPYLNSSLFEPTELEQITLFISNLKDEKTIPVISSTVLKDDQGKKQTGEVKTLEYLFEFLNAYDFASEGSEEIQEENKSLINASVLGLIFEKINGYKDGSFFTPGFITMYMCRETIRKAVVQKFNETKKWNCSTLEELYDKIEDRKEANEIVNSIKICDPAVGSGHFLVSALNEIIAVKNDLKILLDKNGKRLKETSIRVINDALYITDIESDEEHYYIAPAPRSEKTVRYIFGGDSFKYTPSFVTERQQIQETIFHEKQTIIENCLFGVDINPNSVKICRLRLWIELLKNAYYTPESNFTELETLPNIDINIKCGNSLVSRFDIDSNLSQALKKSKWTIESYQNAVATYRNAQNKEQKREMERLISDIKSDFRTEINKNDPKLAKLYKLNGELTTLTTQQSIFGMSDKEKKEWNKKVTQLTEETKKLETEIEDIKTSKIYENAFEWRFEFPEVLNENGDFVGFDVVIGNPPYFSISKLDTNQLDYFSNSNYRTFIKSTDIYCLFIELAQKIGSNLGINHFIVSNKWLTANYGQKTRTFLAEHTSNIFIIDFNKFQIFDEAIVDACLLSFSNKNGKRVDYLEYDIKEKTESVTEFLSTISSSTKVINLLDTWNLGGFEYQAIKDKMELKGKSLNAWNIKFYRGITTGFNDAFVIDENTKNKLIKEDKKNASIIKPLLRGRDIKKYGFEKGLLWLINAHNGLKSIQLKRLDIENNFSSIYNHLNQYKTALINRTDKGDHYTNLRNCAYLEEFEKEKLVFTKASKIQAFAYDNKGHFVLNTSYILVGEKLKYLLALLNSKLFQFGFKNFYQSGGIEGEITIQAIKQIPIVYPTEKQESKINKIVEKIILLKEKDYSADTTALEIQIDQLVYQLYDLTEEEIKIIETA